MQNDPEQYGRWVRCSKDQPCPVCGRFKWCCVSADGGMALCTRTASDRERATGWLHKLKTASFGGKLLKVKPEPKPELSDSDLHEVWFPWFKEGLMGAGRHKQLEKLSDALGIPAWPLVLACVGWLDAYEAWTFPQTGQGGAVVGIALRHPDGRKRFIPGGRAGVFGADLAKRDREKTLYLVEGPSDTLTGIAMGLSVIGRPGAQTGRRVFDCLAPLCEGRNVVVVAENDRREVPNHPENCPGCMLCWPGLSGARNLVKRLSQTMGRHVGCSVPPDGAKDLRAWYRQQKIGQWLQPTLLPDAPLSDEKLGELWEKTTQG